MKEGPALKRFQNLRILMVVAGLILTARIIHVQIILHDEYAARAKRQWGQPIDIPAQRGNLYDRDGRPLALSVTTWQIGVAKGRVKDLGALTAVLGEVLDRSPKDIRRNIDRSGSKHVVLASGVVLDADQMAKLEAGGQQAVTADATLSRIYPTDGVGASLVGFFRADHDTNHATGLEYSLDRYLAGQEGQARKIKTANPRQKLGQVVLEDATHGQSLVLTLDSDLQAICEDRLRDRVEESGAKGGSVLILDPMNGDVLAAASWPLMETRERSHSDGRVWVNRNFTYQFEPGSVFKIFSTAALLRHSAIDTATVYLSDKVKGDGIYVRNDRNHQYGNLNLMQAFSKSSNVYFAKAVGNLSKREFYRDLKHFGFGQETSIPYPGQPAGGLAQPTEWSGRSKQTISIGQEVAVTALQLGLAVCSAANGGDLFAPRLIKEIRNDRGDVIGKVEPASLRRVMASPLTELLRDAMGRVVVEGTGVAAAQDWLAVGGKTGTAQKRCEGDVGYTPGAYIATFAGMAPLDDPRLVVITLLDEPRWAYHYAAQSAAPLFKDIIGDVRRSTDWLTDVPGARTATFTPTPVGEQVTVPDVMLLTGTRAAARLADAGLVAAGAEKDGLVVEQVPAPGTRCRPGQTVVLAVARQKAVDPAQSSLCPDFSGLSNRQVKSLSARLGIPVRVNGVGYAVAQDLSPGTTYTGQPVTVKMNSPWR